MKFGMCVEHYKKDGYSLEQRLELLAKMGIKYTNRVEVRNSDNNDVFNNRKKALENTGMVSVMAGAGIPVWGDLDGKWFGGIGFDPSKEDQYIDDARYYVERNRELGNKIYCVLPPMVSYEFPKEVAWYRSLNYYHKYCEMLSEFGCVCTNEAEAEIDFISCNFNEAIDWMDQVDAENFFLNADTTHFRMWNLTEKQIKRVGDMMIHAHCGDGDGTHIGLVLGEGSTPLVDYHNWMIKYGIDETAKKWDVIPASIIELWIPQRQWSQPDFDEEVRKSLEYAKKNLTMLEWD